MPFSNYKNLFESSSNGRLIIYEGSVIECNQKVSEILQIPYKSIIGQNFAHVLAQTQAYSDFAEQNVTDKLTLTLKGENQTFDWFYLSADQKNINIEITFKKNFIENKNYVEVRLIDTTQRYQMQQAINYIASESASDTDNLFFEKVLKKLAELFTSDYVLIGLYNPTVSESIDTFVVCTHGKVASNFSYDIKNTPSEDVIKKGPCAYASDIQRLFPDAPQLAKINAESFIGVPLFNSQNIPMGLLATIDSNPMENISHVKEIMQIYALRIANEIERLNSNKELKAAKEAAEQAYQAKAEFLSNMSHELRTPLHAILSYSDFGIKKKNLDSEKLLKYFSSIHISGARLLHLVNNLLDLSKMESGKVDLNLTSEKLVPIINKCLDEISHASEEKNIELIFRSKVENDTLFCDKILIHQLLLNLLSNAIKFSPNDSSVEITIHEQNKNDYNSLYLTVSDHGVGIPTNELDSIFNEFIQSSATKTGAGGTGLGLAISKNIVESHNGKIWVTNQPNNSGAIFHITLPVNLD